MATTMQDHSFDGSHASTGRRGHTTPGIEYRVVYTLVFAVCLVLAALLRLFPRRLHPWISPSERPMSLVGEARAAADSNRPVRVPGRLKARPDRSSERPTDPGVRIRPASPDGPRAVAIRRATRSNRRHRRH